MKKSDVVQHFGTQTAVADALGCSRAAVSLWDEIVPRQRAFEIQVITNGVLRVDMSFYDKDKKTSVA